MACRNQKGFRKHGPLGNENTLTGILWMQQWGTSLWQVQHSIRLRQKERICIYTVYSILIYCVHTASMHNYMPTPSPNASTEAAVASTCNLCSRVAWSLGSSVWRAGLWCLESTFPQSEKRRIMCMSCSLICHFMSQTYGCRFSVIIILWYCSSIYAIIYVQTDVIMRIHVYTCWACSLSIHAYAPWHSHCPTLGQAALGRQHLTSLYSDLRWAKHLTSCRGLKLWASLPGMCPCLIQSGQVQQFQGWIICQMSQGLGLKCSLRRSMTQMIEVNIG